MNYESKIREILGEDVEIYEVGETSNKVFKVNTGSKIVYVKFYRDNSSHVDNELKIYDLVSDNYLKEVIYKSDKYNGTEANIASKKMLDYCNVKYRKYEDVNRQIILDL